MVQLIVNGTEHHYDGDGDMPLLWYLRDVLGLTGTKFGCGVARHGACTIHLDGSGCAPAKHRSRPPRNSGHDHRGPFA